MHPAQIVLYGSTLCVMITVHFSMKLLAEHVLNWKKPKEQNAIVIIILMAPLYAVDSYVGLINFFGSEAFFTFLDSIKECYEALVIAKFLGLMYSFLNISLSKNIVPDEIKGREIHHSFPMTLFQPHTTRLDHKTLKLLKNWTWQFVVIRPVCSILMITLQYLEVYPTWVSWTNTVILNISVSLALYSLVVFYHVFSKELEPHKPLAKSCIPPAKSMPLWNFILNRLPTDDILAKAGYHIVSRCKMCHKNLETADHLFLCCPFAIQLWTWLESMRSCSINRSNALSLLNIVSPFTSAQLNDVRIAAVGYVIWIIWTARNNSLFSNQATSFQSPCLLVVANGIVLDLLAALGIIRSRYSWLTVERIEEGYQNLLVCLEMVFFSIYQQYAYSAAPYKVNSSPSDKKSK
ncbi:Transmembrane protein 184B [Glycine max]|nr:Transmembrane protein 184B [Glycine max]